MAEDKSKRYEKIDFLGEGQVTLTMFSYYICCLMIPDLYIANKAVNL